MIDIIKSVSVEVPQPTRILFDDIFRDKVKKGLKSLVFGEIKLFYADLVISFDNET